jgi:peptidyl-prolyl cis-trans isomerase A (cyclophilin A)
MKNSTLAFTLMIVAAGAAALAQTKAVAPKATPAKAAGPNLLNPATLNAKAPAVFLVKMNTTKGPIVIRVTKSWAPIGADRFYNLVRAGFFTDAPFFRVVKGFMAQFGIPARPDVARVWDDKGIFDERPVQSNKRGMLSYGMASGVKNSRTTQIFINMVNNDFLDPMGFAPFGEVIEGMDVVDMLYSGYGEQGNDQDGIRRGGKAFVDKNFPRLDRILTAVIEPLPDAAPKGDAKK